MSANPTLPLEGEQKAIKPRKMKAQTQILAPVPATNMPLLEMAVRNNAPIDVIERLKALYDQERSKAEESEFNAAMNRVQGELVRIAPDLPNNQTNSRYASYAAIDKVLRPIYSKEGFSLSFNTEESKLADHVKIVCFVSHTGGHTRRHEVDMPADGKGARGGDVMSKTHATVSAVSYGKRTLANMVFNLSIGPDDDGNAAAGPMPGEDQCLKAIAEAPDTSALGKIFKEATSKALLAKNGNAIVRLTEARDKRRAELTATEAA